MEELFSGRKNQLWLVGMFYGEKFQLDHTIAFIKGLLWVRHLSLLKTVHIRTLTSSPHCDIGSVCFVRISGEKSVSVMERGLTGAQGGSGAGSASEPRPLCLLWNPGQAALPLSLRVTVYKPDGCYPSPRAVRSNVDNLPKYQERQGHLGDGQLLIYGRYYNISFDKYCYAMLYKCQHTYKYPYYHDKTSISIIALKL